MFQACFGLEARVLPWRRPECITGAGSLQRLPELLAYAGCKEPMIVASRRQCAAPEFITMAEKARVFIDAIYRMNRALGIPECFSCIRSEDLPQMAAWAEANPVYPVPVIFGKEDFIRVARRVMP